MNLFYRIWINVAVYPLFLVLCWMAHGQHGVEQAKAAKRELLADA